MDNKIFFIDERNSIIKTYSDLIDDLNNKNNFQNIIKYKNAYNTFVDLLFGIINERTVFLVDEIIEDEVKDLLDNNNIEERINNKQIEINLSNFLNILKNIDRSKIILFTSGTTGKPKAVMHTMKSLTRFIKIGKKHENDIWGLTYNPVHIAGIQVFFQAILNKNTIVNLYRYPKNKIFELIENYKITHLSGTPTFYKLLLPSDKIFKNVKNITFGGEKFDESIITKIKIIFPCARIKNIYASTELGTLFISENEVYEVPKNINHLIKISYGQLLVHKILINHVINMNHNDSDDWFETGDLVEILSEKPLKFRFVGRNDDIVKIGGYRVNLLEIENILEQHPNVVMAKVYTKTNSLIGNILMADIMVKTDILERELFKFLRERLPEYKIPRIINFVEKIPITRSGKVTRK